jgi:electron transport complex protein RnfG
MALPEISRSMLKNSLVLGLFAVVTVGVVAITQQGTAGRIATAEREAKAQALAQILPAGSYDNHLLDHPRLVFDPLLGNKTPTPAYLATLQGEPTAVILQATAPDGSSGSIFLLAAWPVYGWSGTRKPRAWATRSSWPRARGSTASSANRCRHRTQTAGR